MNLDRYIYTCLPTTVNPGPAAAGGSSGTCPEDQESDGGPDPAWVTRQPLYVGICGGAGSSSGPSMRARTPDVAIDKQLAGGSIPSFIPSIQWT